MYASRCTFRTNRNVAFLAETFALVVAKSGENTTRASYESVPQFVVFVQVDRDSVMGFCGVREMFTNTRYTQTAVTEVTMALNLWRSTFSTGNKELQERCHVDQMMC